MLQFYSLLKKELDFSPPKRKLIPKCKMISLLKKMKHHAYAFLCGRQGVSVTSRPYFVPIKTLRTPMYYNLYNEDEKVRLTRRNEPKEFFQTNLDRKTDAEKLKDPLVWLGLFSIAIPFVILGFFWGYITQNFPDSIV